MSLRYATIENLQADGTDEEGTGGQRLAFKIGETELGTANIARLDSLFPKSNVALEDYNPKLVMTNTIDAPGGIAQNPDFNEGIDLNFVTDLLSRTFDLSSEVTDAKAKDKPQHGVPNVKVTPDDLLDPDQSRDATSSPRRLGGFGSEYKINDIRQGASKRLSIGQYLSKESPIHDGGSKLRLGKSDPAGNNYDPLDRSED